MNLTSLNFPEGTIGGIDGPGWAGRERASRPRHRG